MNIFSNGILYCVLQAPLIRSEDFLGLQMCLGQEIQSILFKGYSMPGQAQLSVSFLPSLADDLC